MTDAFVDNVDNIEATSIVGIYSPTETEVVYSRFEQQGINPLKQYLKEIGRIPRLTDEQHIELARTVKRGVQAADAKEQISNGNIDMFLDNDLLSEMVAYIDNTISNGNKAHNELVEANLRLVVAAAKQYRNRGLDLLDLCQEGNIGLIQAVDKFNPDKGVKFITYATWWIRHNVKRAIANKGRPIRTPNYIASIKGTIYFAREVLSDDLGREPSPEEIFEFLGPKKVTFGNLLLVLSNMEERFVSLDAPRGSESDLTLEETIGDSRVGGTEGIAIDSLTEEEKKLALVAIMEEALDVRENQILALKFGLGTLGKELKNKEIGKLFDLSRQRIEQIVKRGLEKLLKKAGVLTVEELLERIKTSIQTDDS